jgi:hypothetical protein
MPAAFLTKAAGTSYKVRSGNADVRLRFFGRSVRVAQNAARFTGSHVRQYTCVYEFGLNTVTQTCNKAVLWLRRLYASFSLVRKSPRGISDGHSVTGAGFHPGGIVVFFTNIIPPVLHILMWNRPWGLTRYTAWYQNHNKSFRAGPPTTRPTFEPDFSLMEVRCFVFDVNRKHCDCVLKCQVAIKKLLHLSFESCCWIFIGGPWPRFKLLEREENHSHPSSGKV